MPRRGALARRSAADWSVRALLATVAAIVGYFSVAQTLGYALKGSPQQAHILAPGDGRITARLSQKLLAPDGKAEDRAKAERLARLALRQDPTAVRAATTLGLSAQIAGDTTRARRLFAYADALSRRELQTQLWAIEDAVGRNDIVGALRQYDIALRTSRVAADLLFPVLASATSDAAIRSALVRTLAAKPAWGPGFLHYVVSHSPGSLEIASLFLELRRARVFVPEEVSAAAVNALIADKFLDRAWSYYTALRPSADRRRSRDPKFTARIEYPLPFDWTLLSTAGVVASIQQGSQGGVFDFSAPASVGGPMLQQLQMLPAGNYRLEGHSIGIDQMEGSRPYWVLSCRDGRELGRVATPNSVQANGFFSGQFNVPAGCPVQMLAFVARPSDSISGVSGQIDQIRLSQDR